MLGMLYVITDTGGNRMLLEINEHDGSTTIVDLEQINSIQLFSRVDRDTRNNTPIKTFVVEMWFIYEYFFNTQLYNKFR